MDTPSSDNSGVANVSWWTRCCGRKHPNGKARAASSPRVTRVWLGGPVGKGLTGPHVAREGKVAYERGGEERGGQERGPEERLGEEREGQYYLRRTGLQGEGNNCLGERQGREGACSHIYVESANMQAL